MYIRAHTMHTIPTSGGGAAVNRSPHYGGFNYSTLRHNAAANLAGRRDDIWFDVELIFPICPRSPRRLTKSNTSYIKFIAR